MARDWTEAMGDSEDSSNAAQRAHEMNDDLNDPNGQGRIMRWLNGVFGGNASEGGDSFSKGVAPVPRPTHGMMNLRNMRVEDVAIPKAEIVAVPVTITKDDLAAIFRESGLTRLPVFDGTLDTPVGMVHLKDFALGHGFNSAGQRFNLKRMLRPLLFVPPSMTIGVLLTKMQTERRHMALVIDEYGGVDGLVTIEDLIEQVIGEIEDEHDTDEGAWWQRERTGCYLAQAKTPLEDFEAELGRSLTDHGDIDPEEIDTLGGLVFMLAGRVPARGEVVRHPGDVDFEVVDADPRRIKRLRVRLPEARRAVTTAAASAAAVSEPATPPEPNRLDDGVVVNLNGSAPSMAQPEASALSATDDDSAPARPAEHGQG